MLIKISHFTLTGMANIKKKTLKTLNICGDMEQLALSDIAGGNLKWFNHFGKLYCTF